MKEKKPSNSARNLYYLGFLFLFIQGIAILRNYLSNYFSFFWYCDFVSIFFAIAFFIKQEHLAKGLINIGLFAQWIFLFDFFYKLFFGISPLNITTSLFNLSIFFILSTLIVHLSTTIVLIFTYKSKPKKITLLYSLGFLILIYVITLIFTSSVGEINYVYSSGNLLNAFKFHIPYYTELWLAIAFIVLVLPTQGLQYLLYKLSLKKKVKKSKKKILNTPFSN